MTINDLKESEWGCVTALEGEPRFISRITSIGLTPGCRFLVIKNDKNRPVLLFSRDTMIALNRKECGGIVVEKEEKR